MNRTELIDDTLCHVNEAISNENIVQRPTRIAYLELSDLNDLGDMDLKRLRKAALDADETGEIKLMLEMLGQHNLLREGEHSEERHPPGECHCVENSEWVILSDLSK